MLKRLMYPSLAIVEEAARRFLYHQQLWLYQQQRWLQVHWRGLFAGVASGALAGALAVWAARRKQPTAAERETWRRERLVAQGHIVDGVLTGAEPSEQAPDLVFYTYSVAGVRYACSQDVSAVAGEDLGVQLDTPVQVRYLLDNPANSIVLAETWNGLWTSPRQGRQRP